LGFAFGVVENGGKMEVGGGKLTRTGENVHSTVSFNQNINQNHQTHLNEDAQRGLQSQLKKWASRFQPPLSIPKPIFLPPKPYFFTQMFIFAARICINDPFFNRRSCLKGRVLHNRIK